MRLFWFMAVPNEINRDEALERLGPLSCDVTPENEESITQ
jgi:hypothetical protein